MSIKFTLNKPNTNRVNMIRQSTPTYRQYTCTSTMCTVPRTTSPWVANSPFGVHQTTPSVNLANLMFHYEQSQQYFGIWSGNQQYLGEQSSSEDPSNGDVDNTFPIKVHSGTICGIKCFFGRLLNRNVPQRKLCFLSSSAHHMHIPK